MAERKPWHQLPGESDIWYERFDVYRMFPTNLRTINRAFAIFVQRGDLTGKTPGAGWYDEARERNWEDRARAYDDEMRSRINAKREEELVKAQESRAQMLAALLPRTFELLWQVLDQMTIVEARRNLPNLHKVFISLMEQERIEQGMVGGGMPTGNAQLDDQWEAAIEKAYGEIKKAKAQGD